MIPGNLELQQDRIASFLRSEESERCENRPGPSRERAPAVWMSVDGWGDPG